MWKLWASSHCSQGKFFWRHFPPSCHRRRCSVLLQRMFFWSNSKQFKLVLICDTLRMKALELTKARLQLHPASSKGQHRLEQSVRYVRQRAKKSTMATSFFAARFQCTVCLPMLPTECESELRVRKTTFHIYGFESKFVFAVK